MTREVCERNAMRQRHQDILIASAGGLHPGPSRGRRGFTLVELLIAGIVIALVVGAVVTSLAQVGRARASARVRLEAYLRADAALDAVRRDVQSTIRSDDLYWTRLVIFDDAVKRRYSTFDRDELLVFSNALEAARPVEYNGEGGEYETQYRVEEDDLGAVLMQRRDPVPDRWDFGGGVATPLAEGVVGLLVQAYDGDSWYDEWDSDEQGLPWGVRVVVTASGAPAGADPYDGEYPLVTLRTVIPIDRAPPPYEPPSEEEMLDVDGDGVVSDEELASGQAAAAAGGAGATGALSGAGARGGAAGAGAAAASGGALSGGGGGGGGGNGGGRGGPSFAGPTGGGSKPGGGGGGQVGQGGRGGSPIKTTGGSK